MVLDDVNRAILVSAGEEDEFFSKIYYSSNESLKDLFGSFSVKDKAHFIEIAYGSLMEVSSQFEIAEELDYISSEDRLSMDMLIEEDARLLSGLLNSYKPSTDPQP